MVYAAQSSHNWFLSRDSFNRIFECKVPWWFMGCKKWRHAKDQSRESRAGDFHDYAVFVHLFESSLPWSITTSRCGNSPFSSFILSSNNLPVKFLVDGRKTTNYLLFSTKMTQTGESPSFHFHRHSGSSRERGHSSSTVQYISFRDTSPDPVVAAMPTLLSGLKMSVL